MARRSLPDPEHEIDLHGLDVQRALRTLEHGLTFCRARRISPVRVITGRGLGSPDGRSVLAPAVRTWLEGPDGRALGVKECRPTSRGGAFWVRIARDS